jgi:hypothetical protein
MDQIGLQFNDKINNILNNIKDLHNNTSRNKKYQVLSLVSNNFTRKELLQIGFKFSPGQFTKSRKDNVIISRPIQKINEEINTKYKPFLFENSREASNRTLLVKRKIDEVIDNEDNHCQVANKKICVPVRYLNNSITNLYTLYKNSNLNSKMGRSSFFKNIPPEYKKAKKRTDLCPICENGKETINCWKILQKKNQ